MTSQTMKALQLVGPRQTILADLPRPATPADGLLMKTRCVSICSTDISFYEGHLFPSEYPVILGHEYLGQVVEIGPEFANPDITLGDRIVYWGQTDYDGFAEYRTLRPIFSGEIKEDVLQADRNFCDDRRAAAVKVPDELDDLEASFIEPTTGALRSVLANPPRIGDRVLILGAGPIGIIAGSVMKKVLATNQVMSVDANPHRNAHAREHFSDRAFRPEELVSEVGDSTFDYVFDALPTVKVDDEAKDPRRIAMRKLKPGGRYVLYGASQEMQRFDTWLMLAKGINITASAFDVTSFPMHRTANVIASAMRMLLTGIVNGKRLRTAVHPFTDYEGLVEIFRNYRSTADLKTIVDFRDEAEITPPDRTKSAHADKAPVMAEFRAPGISMVPAVPSLRPTALEQS
jgi:threonine dehydrogenase-like Zn-dependent dehydrogenase